MNESDAKLILEEKRYTNGANVPTIHREYVCPCGQGRIVEERVPGFGDWFTRIACENCQKRYYVLEGCGHIWELKEK